MAPDVDRVRDLELMPDRRTLREQWHVLRALRAERFDAAFNFSGSDRTVFWTWFSGARHRAAHAWGRHHAWTRLLIPTLVDQQDPDLPVAEQRRRVLTRLGYDAGPLRYNLAPGTAALERARTVASEGAIHLSVNAAKPLKEWPLEHAIDLTRQLLQTHPEVPVLASGSSREREQQRLHRLAAAVNHPGLRLLPPDLGIEGLTAVLQRCRLHIGPDSGVMNLATAVGIPTVSFFRDQAGYRGWLPVGERHRPFVGRCHCVDHGEAPCLKDERAECLAAIHPNTVFAAVQELLALRRATGPDAD